jgi:5-methylcytosine-specific restriction protein A
MTDRTLPEDIATAVGLIEEATHRTFPVALESNGGLSAWALRLGFGPDEPSVSIYLTSSPYSATATLVPDTFAGRLIRFLGDRAGEIADLWQQMVEEFESDGTKVAVTINGVARTPIESAGAEWQSLEIEANTRIHRPISPQTRGWALASSALGVLALFAAYSDESVQEIDEPGAEEGTKVIRQSIGYERKHANRIRCLNHHGYNCAVCGFSFAQQYGSLGSGFVEVHHIFTVAAMPEGYRPDPKTEMVPLCSNCHKMVHRTVPPMNPDELRQRMNQSSSMRDGLSDV